METTRTARQEWKESWPLAVACLIGFMVPAMYLYSLGPFIAPLEEEFGWSRAQISSGLSVLTIVTAVCAPFIGVLVDRWGPRRLALPGTVLVLCSYGLISLADERLAVWWGLWFLMSLAAIPVQTMVWTAAVAANFDKGRGLALAVALCGSGVAAAVLPPLATWIIDNYGWRTAPPIISLIAGVVILPTLYFGLHSKADRPRRVRGPSGPVAKMGMGAREALLSGRFAKLAAAAFLFSVCVLGIVPNLVPILTSFDLSRADAAAIAGLVGFASMTGRLVTGHLMDRCNPNLVAGTCVLLPIVSCVLLLTAPGDKTLAVLAVVILGLSLGAEVDVIAFLTAKQFGIANYGAIFGVIALLYGLAAASGPVLVNLVYDLSGEYEFALKIAIPFFIATSVALVTLGPPRTSEGLVVDGHTGSRQ